MKAFLIPFLLIFHIESSLQALTADSLSSPVFFEDDTVFVIHSNLGPYSSEERAQIVSDRLSRLVMIPLFDPDSIKMINTGDQVDILWQDYLITTITSSDATAIGLTVPKLAELTRQSIIETLTRDRFWSFVKELSIQIILVILLLAALFYLYKAHYWVFTKVTRWYRQFAPDHIPELKYKNLHILSSERLIEFGRIVLNIVRWGTLIFIFYLALPLLFSIFPGTKPIAATLFRYLFDPVKNMVAAIISYIPDLLTIAITIIIFAWLIRVVEWIAKNIEDGNLKLPGFYPDWAIPTFNIVRFVLIVFAFIIIFPLLPGSDSPVFQGVTVFVGFLVSMGSSTAIGNAIAGLVITYMRPFKPGDRVRIGETTGDIIEKTLLVTRICTLKNEIVTIPNSMILSGHIINYSISNKNYRLIIHTTVTIGYDVPWRKVNELLINAAKLTTGVVDKHDPFVLQHSLDDFYVAYEINAFIEDSHDMVRIKSELHTHIQDQFDLAGIEILSPHYRAQRDGGHTTVTPFNPQNVENQT